jgi:lysophospholipase L1-like esterase
MESEVNKRSRRNKQFVHISIVLIFLSLFIVMLIEMISSLARQPFDVSEGLEVLHQMENADISRIETRIAELEGQEGEAGLTETLSIREFFAGIVVMGDSIADGLLANDVLNPSSVVSNLGVQVSGIGIETEIERLVELNPRIVFLSYGANDILIGHVTTYRFIQAYGELIDGIMRVLPDTTIIINGILPFRYDVVGSAIVEEFNEVLFDLAYNRQIAFLNHGELVREDLYEDDGVHFTPEFYERWAESMRGALEQ